MAEPIEIQFGFRTRVGPWNHILDGGPEPHGKGPFFGGRACLDISDDSAVSCAKTAEPIEMLFGLWT